MALENDAEKGHPNLIFGRVEADAEPNDEHAKASSRMPILGYVQAWLLRSKLAEARGIERVAPEDRHEVLFSLSLSLSSATNNLLDT